VKRSERRHLKQDEFVSGIELTIRWFVQNQRNVVNLALLVVGAGLLLGGLYIYRDREAKTASDLLAEALDQYHGKVRTDTSDTGSGTPSFASQEEKYRTALETFQEISTDYSSYEAGRHATYYAGLCHAALDEPDAAEASLAPLRTGARDFLYYLGSRSLAALKARKQDYAGAAKIYRGLAEDAENPLPKDHLLFELAKAEERAGNLEQARQYYERMLAEHPDSELRVEAMARNEALSLAAEG
jgi:tetratricopeptide (TPR) repeat protein